MTAFSNGSGGPRPPKHRAKLFRTTSSIYHDAVVLLTLIVLMMHFQSGSAGNPDAKRLYDDLLSNYNKLVRPVVNVSDALKVKIKLKLSQLIDVNLKNQIMTTNLWVEQSWYDYKLTWDPNEYGGVKMLHVPSDHIWRPDIVLYNNADGNFEVTLATKATLSYNGLVEWKPPAIYKSSCEIDVEYFPFDEQTCVMKFGSWTYDGFQVDLRHVDEKQGISTVEVGVDLSEFYMSVEWDILEVPAKRNEKFYTCCNEPYLDITFNITMRRKTLFYTVNLIIPCMGISFLTLLVFYLPSDSGEKVSLSISILLSLTVFFLLLAEIIPPTSLVVPLLGKFVLFTMILDTVSICVTVVVLNVHFRTPQTHTMAPWVRRVFLHILPRLLVMRRPQYYLERMQGKSGQSMGSGGGGGSTSSSRLLVRTCNGLELRQNLSYSDSLQMRDIRDALGLGHHHHHHHSDYSPTREMAEALGLNGSCKIHGNGMPPPPPPPQGPPSRAASQHPLLRSTELQDSELEGEIMDHDHVGSASHDRRPKSGWGCPEVSKAVDGVRYIAEHTRREEESIRVKEDWKYVAMVLDRLFLWIFSLAVLAGTAGIILQAPTLYDSRVPIDVRLSEIASATAKPGSSSPNKG